MLESAMRILVSVASWSMPAFALMLFGIQLAAREIGYWFGRRNAEKERGQVESVGVMVGAMLGLLAFVLALTLSFANARFNERRTGTLTEANAIGTAWLRAQAIGAPASREVARLLEEYAHVRADFVRADFGSPIIEASNQRTSELQSQIWAQVTTLVRERHDPVTASLMASVNDVIDAGGAQRFAYAFTLPPQLFWVLIGMTTFGMAALGFQLGLKGTPLHLMGALLTLMWTVVIIGIFDLAGARVGSVRAGTLMYEWTIQGFGQGSGAEGSQRTPQ